MRIIYVLFIRHNRFERGPEDCEGKKAGSGSVLRVYRNPSPTKTEVATLAPKVVSPATLLLCRRPGHGPPRSGYALSPCSDFARREWRGSDTPHARGGLSLVGSRMRRRARRRLTHPTAC